MSSTQANQQTSQPTDQQTSQQGLQQYTDTQLTEELRKRGYEVLKWVPLEWKPKRL